MFKVVPDDETFNETAVGGSLLDQIGRDGARQMPAVGL